MESSSFSDSVVVISGAVFAVANKSGDFEPGTHEGFYAFDTRFLSRLSLTLDGRAPAPVSARTLEHGVASFYATSRRSKRLPAGAVSLVRDRIVSHGLHEDITVINHSRETRTFTLRLTFDADFADLFEVRRGPVRKVGKTAVEDHGATLILSYTRGHFVRETRITFSRQPEIRTRVASFEITLEPKTTWSTCVSILPVLPESPEEPPLSCVGESLGPPFAQETRLVSPRAAMREEERADGPLQDVPELITDIPDLRQTYTQAVTDLRALLLTRGNGHYILAAGLPWFMALFGRDSIIAAIQSKLLGTELMVGTLHALAPLQATAVDRFREAQPGKLPHEVREGALSFLEEVPHSRYYGSVDATPLFNILLWEAFQWTGDLDLVRRFLPTAEAAIRWIDQYGDMDGDGFVEYKRHTRRGLVNQGWKDSWDSTCFADGTLAEGPIALAEVQGYVYDAKIKTAELYHAVGEHRKAEALAEAARRLKKRFNDAFWMPREEYYALALDGRKRQVDAITSNLGHCLWSGIVDQARAPKVAQRLIASDMFSGWGVRTLSSDMSRYNPLSYHNGSIWPHDNSIIAAGLARYGFDSQARQVAMAILDSAATFPDHRLPELFAGYPRRVLSFAVPYPSANAPQAWASGSVIYLLETLLGVTPAGDRLLVEASREGLPISLTGVQYRGSKRII